MLRLALLSARGRLGTFTGALVALIASSALVMAGAMPLEAALRSHPPVERYAAAAAVVTGQQTVGSRPRRPARRTRPRGFRAHRTAGGRPRRPRRDRRRVDAGPPRRPGHRRARVGQRRADALRAEPRTRARTGRRGRHRLPRCARREAAPRVHRRPADRRRRRHRSPPPSRQAADCDLPDRRRGSATGRSSGTRRRDRGACRPRFRRRTPSRRQRRRGRAHRGRARPGRVSRPPAGADDADRRHRVVRRTGAVHRPLRRGQHDGSVDPAARARDRALASGGRDARSDSPHDRVGGGNRRPGGLGGGDLARGDPWPSARPRARAPRHRPAGPVRQRRVAADRGSRRWRSHGGAARRPRRRTARRASVADPRAGPRRGRATAARSGARDRGTAGARRRGAPVRRLGHHRRPGRGGSDIGDDRAVPRGGGRLPGTDRGPRRRRDPGAAARAALARRRLPGVLEPAHRHAALLVGQHAADADRRHELHPAVQRDHDRPRRHPAKAGRPVRRARHHEHRPRLAGRDAGRRARHSRCALGGRADPHDTRPEPGRLR